MGRLSCSQEGTGPFLKGDAMELFGMTVNPAVFWAVVAVIVIALILVIAIPIYKGYKDEMKKSAKKSGSKSKSSSTKKR